MLMRVSEKPFSCQIKAKLLCRRLKNAHAIGEKSHKVRKLQYKVSVRSICSGGIYK